ncbi:MAG TPA: DUF6483 family protein [Thermomicrobiaceae bacterium]|nr:DUF6483 family protein [Thermomicrobiaceae bacterium]
MIGRDYILRLIEQLGEVVNAVLATAGRLRDNGELNQADAVIDAALQRLFGLSLEATETLPSETLLALLRLNQPSSTDEPLVAIRITGMARLIEAAADISVDAGDQDLADQQRIKALQLHLAVLTDEEPGFPAAANAVDPLLEQVADHELPVPTKEQLWQHFEHVGHYAKAEDWMFHLLDDEQAGGDVPDRAMFFYQRLLALGDEELERGNLPREEVLAGLEHVQALPRYYS